MSWKLFLDDERYPPDTDWIVCRSVDDAVMAVNVFGFPAFISFDHDLADGGTICGYDNTGVGLANWIVDQVLDGKQIIPTDFEFYVHSQNPIGAENIRRLLDNFLKKQLDSVN